MVRPDIDWDNAPEGTTHAFWNGGGEKWYGGWCWRRVENDGVFAWIDDEWQGIYHREDEWLAGWKDQVVAKPIAPPVVVINGVEVNWAEAPADATHVVIVHGEFKGWRKVEDRKVFTWEGNWRDRRVTGVANYMRVNEDLLFERPGVGFVAPVVKKEQVVAAKAEPKRQVGWWS